jgi:hypothetical protein
MTKREALAKHCRQFKSDFKNFDIRGRFALYAEVREFLRERITVQQAKDEVRISLDQRAERFLMLARTHIYERPGSPYLKLLKIAGCELSDLEALVRRHGIEPALERLAAEGVYLTSDEFKGKKEIVRGARSFRVTPEDFERRYAPGGFAIESSGTRNRPLRLVIYLDWLRIRTFATGVFFAAHDLFSYSHAIYDAILPGGAVNHILINAKLGKATDRWFARRVPEITPLHALAHHLTTYLIVLAGKRHGPGFPIPRFIEVEEIERIVRWIEKEKRKKKACYVTTIASSAARIARAAWEMGIPLDGTKFNVSGEPFTEAKEEAIRKVGASVTSRYSYDGSPNAGLGCATPRYRDEVHVNQNVLALVRHPAPLDIAGSPIHPLLCTTLHAEAPRMLFNVANGDYATLEERNCGCELERAGLTLHLHHIRSFEKLTSEGMNYFYGELFELLEKLFPAEFGGGPGDYQLVEEEDKNGQTRLTLVVHPEVGPIQDDALLARLREGLAVGPWANKFRSEIWRDAGTFRVQRRVPYTSPRGKILPLHFPR